VWERAGEETRLAPKTRKKYKTNTTKNAQKEYASVGTSR
jgi:hypothetical protein